MTTIHISIPSKGEMKTETVISLIKSLYHLNSNGIMVEFGFTQGTNVVNVRNESIQKFLETEADYMMCIDSDMVFEEDYIYRLLQHDKDIVCGVAKIRGKDEYNVFFESNEGKYFPIYKLNDYNGLVEVGNAGFAFNLIKRSVLEKVSFLKSAGQKSEDIYFAEQCKHKGFKLYCDVDVRLGHVVETTLECEKR